MTANPKTPAAGEDVRIIVCTNRKARHLYHVLEVYEAGIMLQGTEVKSLRGRNATMTDAYAELRNGEIWLHHFHINPYEQGNRYNHEPTRSRKLLLRKKEISKLIGRTVEKGLTLVPLQVYFRNGYARDAGLRIDHFLLSPPLAARLVDAQVDREVRSWEKTSDHAPVWIELAEEKRKPSRISRVKAPKET